MNEFQKVYESVMIAEKKLKTKDVIGLGMLIQFDREELEAAESVAQEDANDAYNFAISPDEMTVEIKTINRVRRTIQKIENEGLISRKSKRFYVVKGRGLGDYGKKVEFRGDLDLFALERAVIIACKD